MRDSYHFDVWWDSGYRLRTLYSDFAGFGLLNLRKFQGEYAVFHRGGDGLGVDVLADGEGAEEIADAVFVQEERGVLRLALGNAGVDCQLALVETDVDVVWRRAGHICEDKQVVLRFDDVDIGGVHPALMRAFDVGYVVFSFFKV